MRHPRPDAAWLQLDRQLCFALYAASHAMTKVYTPLLQPLGLTYPQYLVMLVLWETDGLPVHAIGQRLQLDSGTLTPMLKRLAAAGLVARARDAADERRTLINLTPAGRDLREQALAVPADVLCASGCSLDTLQSLVEQLRALRASLSDAASPAS
jgi:DNA-binding MarR family transcriptional regulator